MPRSLDYRATSEHPAERVYTTMVDREVIEKRLVQMGGPGAEVQEYESTGNGGVTYTLQHGIDSADLPEMVTKLLPGGRVVIKRTEHWSPADGGYSGTGKVAIAGTPATAKATMRLGDTGGGSELVIDVQVTVKVPIVGAKVEEAVAEQIRKLLAAETEFTLSQLA
jgi:hypothetical protein